MHIAVFGLGFIGEALVQRGEAAGHQMDGLSRSRCHGAGVRLDASLPGALSALDDRGAWDALVVTFPPKAADSGFWSDLLDLAPRRVLLGSTSIYQRVQDCSAPVITEETPLQALHPRRTAEEAFLRTRGHVVRLAGLYGGERNPVRWIRDGKVGYEKRQINLVHRDDVADALLGLLALPRLRPVYNLADGQRHTWRQIIDALVAAGHLPPQPPQPPKKNDAFVDPGALRADLPAFRFRDFWQELEGLARS